MTRRIVLPDSRPVDDKEALLELQQDLLIWAEDLLGERDKTWRILPPMFDRGTPHIFYPDPESLKLVMIKLVNPAREDWTKALYKMAHEVIHLLNPMRPDPDNCSTASVLEEGVACAFSFYVLRRCGIDASEFKRHSLPSYKHAHSQVSRLRSGDISAAKRIRREMPPGTRFSSVTSEDLKRIFPDVDAEHADALASMFCRDKTEFP